MANPPGLNLAVPLLQDFVAYNSALTQPIVKLHYKLHGHSGSCGATVKKVAKPHCKQQGRKALLLPMIAPQLCWVGSANLTEMGKQKEGLWCRKAVFSLLSQHLMNLYPWTQFSQPISKTEGSQGLNLCSIACMLPIHAAHMPIPQGFPKQVSQSFVLKVVLYYRM